MRHAISNLFTILCALFAVTLIARQRSRTREAGKAEPSRQTNADRIRAMSDDELCIWINAHNACDGCAFCGVCSNPYSAEVCAAGVMRWLQQSSSQKNADAATLQQEDPGGVPSW